MIIYIDFASHGDSNFYRLQWEKSIINSKISFFSIITEEKFSISKNHFSLPYFFFKNKFFDNIFKFFFQSTVIILLGIWIRFNNKNLKIIFNLHQPFIYWNWMKYYKINDVKIIGIIHDIIEFDTSIYPKMIISTNKKIIELLDSAILHAGKSIFKQKYYFTNNIFVLPFPKREPYKESTPVLKFEYFLLPGRYREEKGFDFVISNWPIKKKNLPLVVMTQVPIHLEKLIQTNENIIYKPNLDSDEFFENLIKHSKAAILMYTEGTNSGILQTLIANQKHVITSNISIFNEHPDRNHFIFCDNNPQKFKDLINSFVLFDSTSQVYSSQMSEIDSIYIKFLRQIF